jgi:hypothetical protein
LPIIVEVDVFCENPIPIVFCYSIKFPIVASKSITEKSKIYLY